MPEMYALSARRGRKPAGKHAEITVDHFGSIRTATIQLAPLVLLVGKNNTGKSYFANLIWAFRSFRTALVRRGSGGNLQPPTWFVTLLTEQRELNSFEAVRIHGGQLAASLNDWLAENESAIGSRLMSFAESNLSGLRVTFNGTLWLSRRAGFPPGMGLSSNDAPNAWEIGWERPKEARGEYGAEHSYEYWSVHSSSSDYALDLFLTIIEAFISGKISSGSNSSYLPAARSGLMLSLPSLYSSLIDNFGIGDSDNEVGELPLATIDFLRRITRKASGGKSSRHSPIADFLEKEILQGSIARGGANNTQFTYAPKGQAASLPMHVTSSLVGELTPLLYLLRNFGIGSALTLEEPEAHLHLSAQRAMARAVARLVHEERCPVALTTHSDTFIQQVNVLMRLYSHPRKTELLRKFRYSEADTIDPDGVLCYEFTKQGGRTRVSKIRASQSGFAVRSLNETLIDLAEEAIDTEMS